MSSAYSTPPPSNRRLTRDAALLAIVDWCSKDTPLLVGVVSMRLGVGWTLAATEELFCELEKAGKIRRVTKEEQARMGLYDGFLLV